MNERIDGRWQVFRVLQGGMGCVYLVLDHWDGTPLAVKTFLGEPDPEVVERFRVETSLWSQLDRHAHIVAMDSFRVINGRPYLFLELVEGGDLADWIGTERLGLRTVLLLALQFCDGMTHAYAHGLKAHRDVKPQNCLMSRTGDCLKITDFGLAKVVDPLPQRHEEEFSRWLSGLLQGQTAGPPPLEPGLTGAGRMLGTCAYMAPEQWRDAASADRRSDVYSFGVMLHEMLTGRLPFSGETAMALAYQHCCAPPAQLALEHPLNADLNSLIQACLAKLPDERPLDFIPIRKVLADLYLRISDSPPPEPVTGEALNAVQLTDKAASLLNMGRVEPALELLEQALERDRGLAHAWINRAMCLRRLGRFQEAVADCERALRRRASSEAWNELATNLALLGDARAEDCFRAGIQTHRDDPLVWHNLGLHLAGRERLDEALRCFSRAISLAPRRGDLRLGQGMALLNLGLAERAEESFRWCLDKDPSHPAAWEYLGLALWEQGRRAEAQPCFERSLEEDPHRAGAWLGLARCYVNARRFEQALPLLERSLQFEPDQALAWHVLGTSNVMLGRNAEGARALERAVELDPEDAEGWFILGQLQLHVKQLKQAYACFQKGALLGHPGAAALLAQFR